jgi:hypothetical protein
MLMSKTDVKLVALVAGLSIVFLCSFPTAVTLAELDHPSLYVIAILLFCPQQASSSRHPDVTFDQV